MRCARTALFGTVFLALGLGGLLGLSGCGGDTGEGGVKVGAAQVDQSVEDRDKAAAAEESAARAAAKK